MIMLYQIISVLSLASISLSKKSDGIRGMERLPRVDQADANDD